MSNVLPDYDKLGKIKEHFEGFSNIAYKDSGGVWTIGFGSTFNHDRQRRIQLQDSIDKPTALRWMAIDVANIIKQANQYIHVKLNPNQSAAIVDYIYNRGISNFLRTQLDELINADPNNKKIADEIMGTGLRDRAGNLLWGLGRRRRAQAYLYFTGGLKFHWPRWSVFKI